LAYGVAEGEAEGEADSSAAAFFFVVFFAGDAAGDASVVVVELFLEVELFLVVVDAPWVVVAPVDVVAVASSFFCDWQPKKAATISTVIKDKTGVFIGLLSLTKVENVDPRAIEQALKSHLFPS